MNKNTSIHAILRKCAFILLLTASYAQNSGINEGLTTYINQALATFRDVLKNGLPEFGIAPLEPIKLNNMSFDGSSNGVNIKFANFTNATLYGLSSMHISKLEVKGNANTVKSRPSNQPPTMIMQLKFDNWTIISNYNMSGKVIGFIPLNGNGKMDMELTNVIIDVSTVLTPNPNGTFSILPKDMKLDIQTGDIKVHFHDLYGGGSMSGFANTIANFFSGRVFNSAKPKLMEKMTTTLTNSINKKIENIKLM